MYLWSQRPVKKNLGQHPENTRPRKLIIVTH